MTAFLSILIVLASILLVVVVYVQNPKGGGLSADFGSAQQIGGVKRTNDFIEKATWSLAGFILVASIVMTSMLKPAKPKTVAPQNTEQQAPGAGNQGAPAQR
ncbi:MAG TPA: preprotein translocase subunit SecG [Fluviicola sp.]|nr:preprotein translocase subunit SecG [Fluviicola sp.]